MKRRDFLTVLAGAAAWASTVRGQEPRPVIGVLGSLSSGEFSAAEAAVIQGLNDTGFSEGINIAVERRWAEGQYNRLPSMAAELVRRGVAVIVAMEAPSSFAAKGATTTIPIVFMSGADPIKLGLVDSFRRPSSNLTGVSVLISDLEPKRLELLHESVPSASTIGLLLNPNNPNIRIHEPECQAAADALGLRLEIVEANTEGDLEKAFTTMVQGRVQALVVMADPFFVARRERLAALAVRHAMPAIYPIREFVEAGGLMSYGTNLTELYRQVGTYAGKILKGVKPADLPVQQSTRVELVINLKTAKALGLTVPASLLTRADEVIE